MAVLDGALIALVVLMTLGVIAGVLRMLSDQDGDGRPKGAPTGTVDATVGVPTIPPGAASGARSESWGCCSPPARSSARADCSVR